ncbi:MAG: hypothetical protein LBT62_00530 [Deltaproteobacteria bacterium]|jgi:hypothetical protein|nr:hypothetical protein [Deltaproteobacteria bacterium]
MLEVGFDAPGIVKLAIAKKGIVKNIIAEYRQDADAPRLFFRRRISPSGRAINSKQAKYAPDTR